MDVDVSSQEFSRGHHVDLVEAVAVFSVCIEWYVVY